MRMKNGTCQLCHTYGKLVDSHIIPKSFHKVNGEFPVWKEIVLNEKRYPRTLQIGRYDQFLCNNCETKLSVIDNKAFDIIDPRGNVKDNHILNNLYQKNSKPCDSSCLQRFLLSVVWRFVKSRNKPRGYSLGPYENEIRRAVFKDGDIWKYPSYIEKSILFINKKMVHIPIFPPCPYRMAEGGGLNTWVMSFGGYLGFVIIDKRSVPTFLNNRLLKNGHPVRYLETNFSDSVFFENVVKAIKTYNID